MMPRYAPLIALLALTASGCVFKAPTRTARPELSVEPWQELTIRSEKSGHTYSYMFAKGPAEDSPSILLLHGGFFDRHMWLNTFELSTRFNVYALEWPDVSLFYTGHITDLGDIARDFLDALGIREIYVAGVSMGAFGAIDLVSRKQDLDVKALFVFSAVMFGITDEEVEKRMSVAKRGLGFAPDRLRRIVEWAVERSDFERAPGRLQMDDIYYTRPYPYYFQVFSMMRNQGATPQDTRRISCPVLLLSGTGDETMPIEVARLSPGVFKDAKMVEFEGYAHSMVFTHGPEMVEAMFAFLKKRGLMN